MFYPDELLTKWQAGEIDNLGSHFGDNPAMASTFVTWHDLNVGWLVPSFYCGDRDIFDAHYNQLCEISQSWGHDLQID